jgi:hypothetical protein
MNPIMDFSAGNIRNTGSSSASSKPSKSPSLGRPIKTVPLILKLNSFCGGGGRSPMFKKIVTAVVGSLGSMMPEEAAELP